MAVVKFGVFQRFFLQPEGETARFHLLIFLFLLPGGDGGGHADFHQRRRPAGLGLGRAQTQQQPIA
jgi:hypothetical protein